MSLQVPSPDLRDFIQIKPITNPKVYEDDEAQLVAASSSVGHHAPGGPTRERHFWYNYNRRKLRRGPQGFCSDPGRPYEPVGDPISPVHKILVLEPLAQYVEEPPIQASADISPHRDAPPSHDEPRHSTGGSKSLPIPRHLAGKREDSVCLRKHLDHARRLVSAVKQGTCYFHLLLKEEEEERQEEEERRRSREEQLKAMARPPRVSSDSDNDSEGGPSQVSCVPQAGLRNKRTKAPRPFTPVHRSLTSPLISEMPREAIYRQLCCLTWLLEALRPERSGRVGPVTSCWDLKEPGRARTPRAVLRERAIQSKWEQFVSTSKLPSAAPRPPRCSSSRLHLLQRSSALSLASSSSSLFSSSAPPAPMLSSSLSSLGPGEEEQAPPRHHVELSGGAVREEEEKEEEEEEVPVSRYLRRLLDAVRQSVRKDLYGSESNTLPDSMVSSGDLTQAAVHPAPNSKTNKADSSRTKSCPARKASSAQTQPGSRSQVSSRSQTGSRSQVSSRSQPGSMSLVSSRSLVNRSLVSSQSQTGSRSLVSSSSQVSIKSSMVADLRAAQDKRLGEMAQSYADVLDQTARKRLNSSLQKYRALDHSTGSKLLPGHVTCPLVTTVNSLATGTADIDMNNQRNNMWLSSLLSRLPVEVCREREVSRVLQKLSGLAGEETARVRPHHFVKVLGGLQPWELCLPDLCVAIEIVRENVVQMPREEYDAWLCSRVNLPSQFLRSSTRSR